MATGKSSVRNKLKTEAGSTLLATQSTDGFPHPKRQAGVSDGFQTLGYKIKLIQQIEIFFWKKTFFPLIIRFTVILVLLKIENFQNHSL